MLRDNYIQQIHCTTQNTAWTKAIASEIGHNKKLNRPKSSGNRPDEFRLGLGLVIVRITTPHTPCTSRPQCFIYNLRFCLHLKLYGGPLTGSRRHPDSF